MHLSIESLHLSFVVLNGHALFPFFFFFIVFLWCVTCLFILIFLKHFRIYYSILHHIIIIKNSLRITARCLQEVLNTDHVDIMIP